MRVSALLAATLVVAGLLGAAPAGAETIGVTAAVNPQAQSAPPGAGLRALSLGDNLIQNERVTTDGAGLVQVLFVDGTTLTLGPRSDLVIDRYIYDPERNTAELAATMTKGVLRFIGGVASKGDNGVAITVPTGTIGIRGAIADISLNPGGNIPPHVDLLFGTEVSLNRGGQVVGRLYQTGYSLLLEGGSGRVVKTPPEWSSQIIAALTGGPGTTGGSPNRPTSQTVVGSGLPASNSQNGVNQNAPPGVIPPTQDQLDQILLAIDTYETFKPPPPDLPTGATTTTRVGASGGIVNIVNYNGSGAPGLNRFPAGITTGSSLDTAQLTTVTFDGNGNVIAGTFSVTLMPGQGQCEGCQFDVSIDASGAKATATDSSGTYVSDSATGSIYTHDQVALPAGVTYCECAFAEWGLWNTSATFTIGGERVDTNVTGAWVVGDLTSPEQIMQLAVNELPGTYATYSGHAIGTASRTNGPTYTAAGAFDMSWSFANETGTFNIYDFDGRDFTGSVVSTGGEFFAVSLSGGTGGAARGAFINDGATPAGGVGGDFWLTDVEWAAAGIFVGEKGPDGFNPVTNASSSGLYWDRPSMTGAPSTSGLPSATASMFDSFGHPAAFDARPRPGAFRPPPPPGPPTPAPWM